MMGKKSQTKGYRVEHELVKRLNELGIPARRVPLSGATSFAKGDVHITLNNKDYIVEVKARANGFAKWYKMVGAYLLFKDGYFICSYQTFIKFLKGEEIPVKATHYEIGSELIDWIRNADLLFMKADFKDFLVMFREVHYNELMGALR